jgi:tRNA wybutosine-synthesizing protein 3
MTFQNEKKTFLDKLDRSKKGSIDEKCVSIINLINSMGDYYTTSSCSGRVNLWNGNGKKNETEWIRVSHNLVDNKFFQIKHISGLVWLRVEPFILHVACKDIDVANKFLNDAKTIYKKSSILSASNKIIVELRGSDFLEMPLYEEGKWLLNEEIVWLLILNWKKSF